jgi:hypothetical protein
MGSPRLLGHPLHARHAQTPRRMRRPACPSLKDTAAVFKNTDSLDIRDSLSFRGQFPMAHMLARLRIASAVTYVGARLTTDLPGSALVGRVSHPLDD